VHTKAAELISGLRY